MAMKRSKAPEKVEPAERTPTRWGGMHPLLDLRHEIDDLFDGFLRGFPTGGLPRAFGRNWRSLTPEVDVSETDTALKITAELPGMDEGDVEVTLSDDVLTIKGEKREESEEKDKDFHITERRYGSFQRSFRLPEGIAADKIEAGFDKGVLIVSVPKTAKSTTKAKKISIKKK